MRRWRQVGSAFSESLSKYKIFFSLDLKTQRTLMQFAEIMYLHGRPGGYGGYAAGGP